MCHHLLTLSKLGEKDFHITHVGLSPSYVHLHEPKKGSLTSKDGFLTKSRPRESQCPLQSFLKEKGKEKKKDTLSLALLRHTNARQSRPRIHQAAYRGQPYLAGDLQFACILVINYDRPTVLAMGTFCWALSTAAVGASQHLYQVAFWRATFSLGPFPMEFAFA
jgi:hypothetical protein